MTGTPLDKMKWIRELSVYPVISFLFQSGCSSIQRFLSGLLMMGFVVRSWSYRTSRWSFKRVGGEPFQSLAAGACCPAAQVDPPLCGSVQSELLLFSRNIQLLLSRCRLSPLPPGLSSVPEDFPPFPAAETMNKQSPFTISSQSSYIHKHKCWIMKGIFLSHVAKYFDAYLI